MMDIISESFNFNRFCEAVKDLEFLQLINAAQDEIGRLKHHFKKNSGVCKFISGSKEDNYYKDLMLLLKLLLGHKVSINIRQGFIEDALNLFRALSYKYDFPSNDIDSIVEFAKNFRDKSLRN